MRNPYQQAASQFQKTELNSQVESASPHKLIDMLLAGAKSNISCAKVCMEHNQIEKKGIHVSKALSIVGGLQSSLDMEKGGEISVRLEQLYDYIQRILVQANLHNNPKQLDEAYQLLNTIHEGWQQIGEYTNEPSRVFS